MKMITAQEAAEKWDISLRRVQDNCKKGKIIGAQRFGNCWMIPEDANRPQDGRTKAAKNNNIMQQETDIPLPRKSPLFHMTDLYNKVGTADECIESLSDNPEAKILMDAWIAYARGEIDTVYGNAYYLLQKHSGFYAIISAGMLFALCAIWRGDLIMWRQAKIHIAEAPAKTDMDREILALSLTAIDSMLYDVSSFPEWFKMGRFETLPKEALPAAYVVYAEYLYAMGYALATKQMELQGIQGMSLLSIIPSTIEPMVSQVAADNIIAAEIYLRLTCAVVYHNAGNDTEAIYHLDKAIAMALPDRLYGMLAEYCRTLDSLLEQRINLVNPKAWERVHELYQIYNEGWAKLSGSVRGKTIITSLSAKQREVAKLAAFGMKNDEIAQRLHMSIPAVKQAVRNVSNRTGLSRDEFAAVL